MQNLKQAMRSLTGFLLGLREAGIGRAGWGFFLRVMANLEIGVGKAGVLANLEIGVGKAGVLRGLGGFFVFFPPKFIFFFLSRGFLSCVSRSLTSRLPPAPVPVPVLGRVQFHVRNSLGGGPRSPCQRPWGFGVVPFFLSFHHRVQWSGVTLAVYRLYFLILRMLLLRTDQTVHTFHVAYHRPLS